MSFEQAYHTCCRDGLTTSTLAFQFQSASPSLDTERLSAVARLMVGYVPPPSAPPAPAEAELLRFPLSLRYLDVPGVGPCVSQTVYVGREDREAGDGGRGRFGNYFSHIVVAVGRPVFDEDRHPIQTWRSSAWHTNVGAGAAPILEALPSGPVTLAGALDRLADPLRTAWLPFLFDALQDALRDRARVVILDDGDHAWAWIAAVALSLPIPMAQQLTFDTYDGQPERSAVRICVSDPSVDRSGLGRKALTGEVKLVDLQTSPPPIRSLLGRTAMPRRAGAHNRTAHAAGFGAVPALLDVDELAVWLAIHRGPPEVLSEDDLTLVLRVLTRWLKGRDVRAQDLEAMADLMESVLDETSSPASIDPQALSDAIGAMSETERAIPVALRTITTRLLLRLPDTAAKLPVDPVPNEGITPGLVGDAIALVSNPDGSLTTVQRDLALLGDLQLIGVNSGLDRRIGRVAARFVDDRVVGNFIERAASRPGGERLAEHVLKAIAKNPTPEATTLHRLARPPLRTTLTTLVGPGEAFPLAVLRALADTQANPDERGEHLFVALCFAKNDAEADRLVDSLYGDFARDVERAAEVIAMFVRAKQRASVAVLSSAWAALETIDPLEAVGASDLVADLRKLDPATPWRPVEYAIGAAAQRNRGLRQFFDEIVRSRRQFKRDDARRLLHAAVRDLSTLPVEDGATHGYVITRGWDAFREQFVECYCDEMSYVLADTSKADLVACMFVAWFSRDIPDEIFEEIIERYLPRALRIWQEADRDRVHKVLYSRFGLKDGQQWDAWCEDFPPSGRVGRALGRLRRRRPE